jgi:hypothetical protein
LKIFSCSKEFFNTIGGLQTLAAPARVLPQIEESSHSRVRYADPLAATVVKVKFHKQKMASEE